MFRPKLLQGKNEVLVCDDRVNVKGDFELG